MKVRITFEMPAAASCPDDKTRLNANGKRVVPVGTEFEGGDCHLLMLHGCAEAADKEAEEWLATVPPPNTVGKLLQAHQSITEDMDDFRDEMEADE